MSAQKTQSTKPKGKKTSAKKGKEAVPSAKYQVWGIVWLAVGVFLFLSMNFSMTGVVGQFFSNAGRGLFGIGAFILCLIPFLMGIRYLMKESKGRLIAKSWADILLVLSVSTLSHLIFNPSGSSNMIKALYLSGIKLSSGGVVGGSLGNMLSYLFGRVGAGLIIAVCMLLSLILGTGLSFHNLNKKIKEERKKSAVRRNARKRDKEQSLGNAAVYNMDMPKSNPFNLDIPVSDGINLTNPSAQKLELNLSSDLSDKPDTKSNLTSDMDEVIKNAEIAKPTEKGDSIAKEEQHGNLEDAQNKLYNYPPLTLLKKPRYTGGADISEELRSNAAKLIDTLKSFNVDVKLLNVSRGPAVTRYELQPSAGVKVSKIVNLADDIALNLASPGIRIEAPIPGKAAVGIEVPNKEVTPVSLREILETAEFKKSESVLSAALGKDISGSSIIANIAKMPHVLIAGATGSGKSVCINTIITSILYKASPKDVRLLMIDPKVVELGVYNGIPHLLIPVVTDPKKAAGALNWAVSEMLNRYKLFAEAGVRDIAGYNSYAASKQDTEPLPRAVIIIDELADLMMAAAREVEDAICRLAQMARAAGMYLVIATQRPSVDVITGVIKANIPSRISFAVSSQVDSRTILDMGGAEKLIGKGDMLYLPSGTSKPLRVQGCFISDKEVEAVVEFIKKSEVAQYNEAIIEHIENNAVQSGNNSVNNDEDEMLPQAIETVIETGMASTSLLQRRLKLGYARAARIIDDMAAKGLIGPYEGSKPRQVLITRQQWLEMKTTKAEN